jgi:Ser/Thr protein kinase RdoA (MazF antagonist)
MLAPVNIPAYLEGAGFLDRAQIVDGPLAIRVAPGRAHNFIVETGAGRGFFVKQRDPEDRRDHLSNEAAVWEALQTAAWTAIADHLPHLRHRDPERGLLVFDLLPDMENLHARLRRTGRFSRDLNRQLGTFCGRLHRLDPNVVDPRAQLPAETPWILSVHEPGLALLERASGGNIHLVEEIQRRPELGTLLGDLRARWRGKTIIHGDMRWSNVLVSNTRGSNGRPRIKVIDWEMGGRGDPLWDVAGILSNYLVLWLASIPATGDAPLTVGLSRARYPLPMLQPAVRAFWTAYLAARGLDPSEAGDAIETVTRYTAVRLLQWAYEHLHDQTAPSRLEMALIDLSFNLSQRPAEGAAHLLGISAAGTAP